jgi:hypothetical protein
VDFELRGWNGLKKQALLRKDDALKNPIWNIRDADALNLAGCVDVVTQNPIAKMSGNRAIR